MPGTYTEDCVLKANVFVCGFDFNSTRIVGNWTVDNTFTPAGDWRSGFVDLGIFGNFTADFLSIASLEGKIYSWNTRFAGNITFTAFNTLINQFVMYGGETFGTYTQTGGNGQFYNVTMQAGSVVLNEQTGSSPIFVQYGGASANLTVNAITLPFLVILQGTTKQGATLTLNGTVSTIVASATGLPLENLITYSSGATAAQIFRVNDAFGEAYTPSVPANWSPVPTTAQEAFDQIAARLVAGGL